MFHKVAYEREVLSCSTCKAQFKAELPEGVQATKSVANDAIAMAGVSRYLMGLPHYRIAVHQELLGCRVPSSTLFEMSLNLSESLSPIFEELVNLIRESHHLNADDSKMPIYSLLKGKEGRRKSGTITGVHGENHQGHPIHLYRTGDQNAGEFLDEILEMRKDPSPLVLMTDALAANNPTYDEITIKHAKCLTHARRNFHDELFRNAPTVIPVLETLKKVWEVEEHCRRKGITGSERMMLHRRESAPAMVSLYLEARNKVNKELEPVTDLYKAYAYFLRHWKGLTLFLREPDCEIDNNATERMLKKAILHRKNSLIYRSLKGAGVGDIIMSVGFTALQNSVDPFYYFLDILNHRDEVENNIKQFLPWNWKDNKARAGPNQEEPEQIPAAA
jgi:hypothetical protein